MNAPKKWNYMALAPAAPPMICVVSTGLGAVITPKDGDWMGWALIGLLIATIVTLVLSIRWAMGANHLTRGWKIVYGIACFAGLMFINCAVSFAGCAVGWSTVGHFPI